MTQYLNEKEAAERSKLSPAFLKRLRGKGGGPAYLKFERRVVYPADDLESWLQSHRVRSTSEAAMRGAA